MHHRAGLSLNTLHKEIVLEAIPVTESGCDWEVEVVLHESRFFHIFVIQELRQEE